MNEQNKKTVILVQKAMLTALAVVLMLTVRFPLLPAAKFLEYDMGDIPVVIATLMFGIPSGAIILVLEALVQSLTVSAASSWEGFVMHVLSSLLFISVTYFFGSIGKKKEKKRIFLTVGLVVAVSATAAVMIPLNLIFTPMYLGVPVQSVKEMMLPIIVPFNLIKCTINAVVSVALYAPLVSILKKTHLYAGKI